MSLRAADRDEGRIETGTSSLTTWAAEAGVALEQLKPSERAG
jgi:hypothetical protein